MTFYEELFNENKEIWDRALNSDFIQQMGDGTLDDKLFTGYMVDDSLYLRECAKVFAWGMTKRKNMTSVKTYYSLMSFVNESEMSTRIQYLEKAGLKDEYVENLPQRPENLEYTTIMIEAAKNGMGEAECMTALMPCMASYQYIFEKLVQDKPQVLEGRFAPMVLDYCGPEYKEMVDGWIDMMNQFCEGISEERLSACRKLFRECSLCEEKFWQMSMRERDDI